MFLLLIDVKEYISGESLSLMSDASAKICNKPIRSHHPKVKIVAQMWTALKYFSCAHFSSYTGHVHQENFQYGETYGNKTARLLSEYRTTKLQDSTLGVRGRGGDAQIPFPTYYDQDPSCVIGTRPRTWERWQPQHKCDLLNSSSREGEIRDFNKVIISVVSMSVEEQHFSMYVNHLSPRSSWSWDLRSYLHVRFLLNISKMQSERILKNIVENLLRPHKIVHLCPSIETTCWFLLCIYHWQAAQQHREQYKDHSATRPPVDIFVQPKISYPTTAQNFR